MGVGGHGKRRHQVGEGGRREYRERQLESGRHLWDKLETSSNGNSGESVRLTLAKTPSRGGYGA